MPSASIGRYQLWSERVGVEVIVLNGGSSSGKSSLARCLQDLLGPNWLTLGVDDLVRALPDGDRKSRDPQSIDFKTDGSITVGADFRRAEAAWYQGLAAIARYGTGLIIDEVFLGGRASQKRLAEALSDLTVLWVGVRCDPESRRREKLSVPTGSCAWRGARRSKSTRMLSTTSYWTRPAQAPRTAPAL